MITLQGMAQYIISNILFYCGIYKSASPPFPPFLLFPFKICFGHDEFGGRQRRRSTFTKKSAFLCHRKQKCQINLTQFQKLEHVATRYFDNKSSEKSKQKWQQPGPFIQKQIFLTNRKKRKLANIQPSLHFYGTIFWLKKGLCKGMAWLLFQKQGNC